MSNTEGSGADGGQKKGWLCTQIPIKPRCPAPKCPRPAAGPLPLARTYFYPSTPSPGLIVVPASGVTRFLPRTLSPRCPCFSVAALLAGLEGMSLDRQGHC